MPGETVRQYRSIPVEGSYDVIVAGGGIAGIAAALAAARNGSAVLLAEREWAPGGLATLGLITIYLPLCDGKGRQVSFGIAEELLRLALAAGYEGHYPEKWIGESSAKERADGQRFETQYNPHLFSIACEKLMRSEGVDILYGTSVTGADMYGDRIRALICENRSGCMAFRAKAFVDATGDAGLCRLSGAKNDNL